MSDTSPTLPCIYAYDERAGAFRARRMGGADLDEDVPPTRRMVRT